MHENMEENMEPNASEQGSEQHTPSIPVENPGSPVDSGAAHAATPMTQQGSGDNPRTRLDDDLFRLTPEEEEIEAAMQAQQESEEQQHDAEAEAGLAIYPWFLQVQEMTRRQAAEADVAQKDARIKAAQALAKLSDEDRANVEAWVGKRDRMQQGQGAINAMKRLSTPLHNLDRGLARARREVSKTRHERNRIKTVALEQGVRLSRKLMGRLGALRRNKQLRNKVSAQQEQATPSSSE